MVSNVLAVFQRGLGAGKGSFSPSLRHCQCNNRWYSRYSPREARSKRQVRSEMAQQIRDKEEVPDQSYAESRRLILASDFVLLPRNKAAF